MIFYNSPRFKYISILNWNLACLNTKGYLNAYSVSTRALSNFSWVRLEIESASIALRHQTRASYVYWMYHCFVCVPTPLYCKRRYFHFLVRYYIRAFWFCKFYSHGQGACNKSPRRASCSSSPTTSLQHVPRRPPVAPRYRARTDPQNNHAKDLHPASCTSTHWHLPVKRQGVDNEATYSKSHTNNTKTIRKCMAMGYSQTRCERFHLFDDSLEFLFLLCDQMLQLRLRPVPSFSVRFYLYRCEEPQELLLL